MSKAADARLSACAKGPGGVAGHGHRDGQWIWCVRIWLCWPRTWSWLLQLLSRRDALRARAARRRKLLEDSWLLQKLYEDSDDLKNWINKKKKLADDEDYKVSRVFRPWTHSSGLNLGDRGLRVERMVVFSGKASFTEEDPKSLKTWYSTGSQESNFWISHALLSPTSSLAQLLKFCN